MSTFTDPTLLFLLFCSLSAQSPSHLFHVALCASGMNFTWLLSFSLFISLVSASSCPSPTKQLNLQIVLGCCCWWPSKHVSSWALIGPRWDPSESRSSDWLGVVLPGRDWFRARVLRASLVFRRGWCRCTHMSWVFSISSSGLGAPPTKDRMQSWTGGSAEEADKTNTQVMSLSVCLLSSLTQWLSHFELITSPIYTYSFMRPTIDKRMCSYETENTGVFL